MAQSGYARFRPKADIQIGSLFATIGGRPALVYRMASEEKRSNWDAIGASGILAYSAMEAARLLTKTR